MSKIELGVRRGHLVEREKVEAFVFERMREIRDSWSAWAIRIAPLLAADLGLEDDRALQRALAKYVKEHLEELADGTVGISQLD